MSKNKYPFLGQMLKKIAPRIGAKVILEPKWKFVGQIIFKNGRKRYFRYTSIDLNSLGASEVARDKSYTDFFMKRMRYSIVPRSETFFKDTWAKAIGQPDRSSLAAYSYAKKIGFPVFVKPNSGSQGSAVSLAHNEQEFFRAIEDVFKIDKVALVQPKLEGKDYRLVVLDQKIISAYERIPFNVVGDGKLTIFQLIKNKQKDFVVSGRDTQLNIDDPRIKEKLQSQGMGFETVLKPGEKVFLLDNANLSTGGDSYDVTDKIHPDFKKLAIKLTKDMGLRLCGVDLIVEGNIEKKPKKYWILEINSAPGLDHYAKSGKAQEKIVENLYLEVLKSMEN